MTKFHRKFHEITFCYETSKDFWRKKHSTSAPNSILRGWSPHSQGVDCSRLKYTPETISQTGISDVSRKIVPMVLTNFSIVQVRNNNTMRRPKLSHSWMGSWHAFLGWLFQLSPEPPNLRLLQPGLQGGLQGHPPLHHALLLRVLEKPSQIPLA